MSFKITCSERPSATSLSEASFLQLSFNLSAKAFFKSLTRASKEAEAAVSEENEC